MEIPSNEETIVCSVRTFVELINEMRISFCCCRYIATFALDNSIMRYSSNFSLNSSYPPYSSISHWASGLFIKFDSIWEWYFAHVPHGMNIVLSSPKSIPAIYVSVPSMIRLLAQTLSIPRYFTDAGRCTSSEIKPASSQITSVPSFTILDSPNLSNRFPSLLYNPPYPSVTACCKSSSVGTASFL